MKRKAALLLSGVMALSAIMGCGSTNSQTAAVTPGGTGTASEAENTAAAESTKVKRAEDEDGFQPLKERVTLTIGKSESSSDSYEEGDTTGDNFVLRWFEDQLNVDYEYAWTATGDAYSQKSALVISMGDLPDVMTVSETQMRQLVKADLIADLTDAYEAYASDQLRAAYDTTNGIALKSATFNGRLMAMPNINPGADGIPLLYVRSDWMEELGLEEPKTLDDICNIVKAFQKEKDSMGLVACKSIASVGNNMYGLDALFALYHAYPEMWVTDENGNVEYGSIRPETKTALESIAKLVQEGIIDKDFAVKDSDQCNELVTSGKGGIFFGSWWNYSWPLKDMWKTDESIDWNIYAVPLDGEGIYNVHMMNPSTSYLVVRKDCENLEAVIKTLNLQRKVDSNEIKVERPRPEAFVSWTMFPFTILMTTYDDKEQIWKGLNDVLEGNVSYEDATERIRTTYDSWKYVQDHGKKKAVEDQKASDYGWAIGSRAIVEAEDHMNRVYASTYSHSETMDKKWATLEKLEDETFLQIILGEKPIEEFDHFVEQWKSLGGDEITAELQQMVSAQ
ncbi:MAG: extracellular solute-binding protein [Eubacteriales bacterium]|nr:extracellular solute-binding protein [Eubacteriales bacterium]